jgi:hypothetical protein
MGISEGEYTGRSFIDFHSPEEAEFIAKVDEIFRTGESIRMNTKARTINTSSNLKSYQDQYGAGSCYCCI